MPGETAEDALLQAEAFRAQGASTILTILGENVEREEDVRSTSLQYHALLREVSHRGLDAEISVKPTQLGIDLSPDLALQHVLSLAAASAEVTSERAIPLTLWIDMESSAYLERTLELFRAVRSQHENVGLALQTYLRRTPSDLEALVPLRPIIRLVKGAYLERAEVAYPDKADVDEAYFALARRLLEARKAGLVGRPSIATHDEILAGRILGVADEIGLPREAFEFAMLYGIGTGQQKRLLAGGRQLRVLISYGSAWFPWYMRRLAERPANLWFVIRQMVGG
jgi:proline dehydrogenase